MGRPRLALEYGTTWEGDRAPTLYDLEGRPMVACRRCGRLVRRRRLAGTLHLCRKGAT